MVILEKRTLDIKGPGNRDQSEVLGDDLDGLQQSERGDRVREKDTRARLKTELEKKLE